MKLFYHLAIATLSAFLLVCTCTYSVTAQGGCTPPPPSSLINGPEKNMDNIPNIQAALRVLRSRVGGRFVTPWTVFSATQMQQHGLWCQVNTASNAGMGSNIGDMFYSTGNGPDGFTLVPTSDPSNNVPYQQLKCTNQIGVVVDGNVINFQGFLKCNSTIPDLDRDANYWVVYSDAMFMSYSGPTVNSTMTLSVLSSRDADPNIDYSLSFTVSFGPPSRIRCTRDSMQLFDIRSPDSRVTREVIRSRYISSAQPDMSRVTVRLDNIPRGVERTYTCTVIVEGRTDIAGGSYNFDVKGSGSSTVTVTVAGTPTGVTVSRTAATNVRVSWTAPSTGPTLGGYEVFYQTAAGSNGSNTTDTTTTELTLTGLVLGQTYSIFVVAFGPEGAPVLPSAHSNTEMITLTIPQLTDVTLNPTTSSIMVSWTAPQFTPDNYSVSVNCSRLCDNAPTTGMQLVSDGGATSHTITPLDPGIFCTVSVAAVFGSTSSVSENNFTTTTLTAAPAGVPETLNNTSVESRSLTVVWGTVPCPDQRGPITGYKLRYSNGTSIVIDITGEGSRQRMLTGLTPFTSYSVQVAAVNAGGTGPYSDPALTVETLQDVPGPVSGLLATPGVVQLTISWSPPSEPNGRIIAYQLQISSNSSAMEFNTSATQHTLRDLTPNTVVVFSVRAYTIIGPGENVTDQASTASIPRVTRVRVVALNSTAVNVSWTPLTIQETEYHYTVHYTAMCSFRVTFPASASSGVVSGLQDGQQYQFSVTVTFNVSGEIYTGQTSIASISLVPSSHPPCSTYTSLLVALIVVGMMLFASLIVNTITTTMLLKRRYTSKSPQTSLDTNPIYDIPDKQTSDTDIKMADCAAYDTHQPQQQYSSI